MRSNVFLAALAYLLFMMIPQDVLAQPATITCSSNDGARQHCPADTSSGVALQRSLGPGECLLGNTWGYDSTGIWVSDGCSGEFVLGQKVRTTGPDSPPDDREPSETWGAVVPTKGFLVGKTEIGDLYISAYALARYLNQLPPNQTFTDHLGVVHEVDPRNDIFSHRVMVFFRGWIGLPKLIYQIILWTVNTTDQKAWDPLESTCRHASLSIL